jgi:hypothetical protein
MSEYLSGIGFVDYYIENPDTQFAAIFAIYEGAPRGRNEIIEVRLMSLVTTLSLPEPEKWRVSFY